VTRTRLVLSGLLLGALVLGMAGAGGRVFREITSLNHQTSDTAYRTAVADGGSAVLRSSGVVLRRPLTCSPLDRIGTGDVITCRGITSQGLPVVVSGRVGGAAGQDPQQEYLVSVGDRRLWQGTCLGPSCRLP
jgi:hypothetical protein